MLIQPVVPAGTSLQNIWKGFYRVVCKRHLDSLDFGGFLENWSHPQIVVKWKSSKHPQLSIVPIWSLHRFMWITDYFTNCFNSLCLVIMWTWIKQVIYSGGQCFGGSISSSSVPCTTITIQKCAKDISYLWVLYMKWTQGIQLVLQQTHQLVPSWWLSCHRKSMLKIFLSQFWNLFTFSIVIFYAQISYCHNPMEKGILGNRLPIFFWISSSIYYCLFRMVPHCFLRTYLCIAEHFITQCFTFFNSVKNL